MEYESFEGNQFLVYCIMGEMCLVQWNRKAEYSFDKYLSAINKVYLGAMKLNMHIGPALINWLEQNDTEMYTGKETAVVFLQMGNVKGFELELPIYQKMAKIRFVSWENCFG